MLLPVAVASLSVLTTFVWANTQPYAGQDTRPIAALSAQDIDDLQNGRGWGLALPAELNGYPGPVHVLELADDLNLTADQRAQVQAVFGRMKAGAIELGTAYIAAEQQLNDLFENGAASAAQIRELTGTAAEIRGQLRAVHLAAHLEIPTILTRHQAILYKQLRGYAGGQGHSGHNTHSGHSND